MQVITDVVTCIAERMHAFGEEGNLYSFQFSSRQRLNHHSARVFDVLWPWILVQFTTPYSVFRSQWQIAQWQSQTLILQKLCVHCQDQGSQVSSIAGFNKNIFHIHNDTFKTEQLGHARNERDARCYQFLWPWQFSRPHDNAQKNVIFYTFRDSEQCFIFWLNDVLLV